MWDIFNDFIECVIILFRFFFQCFDFFGLNVCGILVPHPLHWKAKS